MLELKDIQNYPMFGENKLKIQVNREDGADIISLTPSQFYLLGEGYHFDDWKPLLRPMSDLYKPCLEGGLIPIVELAKIAFPCFNWLLEENRNLAIMAHPSIGYFSWEDGHFESSDGWDAWHTPNQIELFQKLYEWHFDIHGLIEQNKAIDINTLK